MENETQQNTGIAIFDGGSFEHMYRVAKCMSAGSLVPASLKGATPDETAANCLRVVEQAQRWGFSPFAVMDHASVVHGKLMWEGKLVSAALDATLGIKLKYNYSGNGQQRKVVVTGSVDGEDMTVEGTVAGWKTSKNGSPWEKAGQHDQMLAYRGAREWTRRYAPSAILGVYTQDEFDEKPGIRNVTQPAAPINPFEGRTPKIEAKPEPTPKPVTEEPKPAKKSAKKAAKKAAKKIEPVEEAPKADVNVVHITAKIADYTSVHGVNPKTQAPYTLHTIVIEDEQGNKRDVKTYSNTIGGLAEFNIGEMAMLECEGTPKGVKVLTLEVV
ncbi:MAG: recombinase RecT [Gammaproteobacteria bacterium]|nr:recombinase RecT [Gammaproteobacteria bacterium]